MTQGQLPYCYKTLLPNRNTRTVPNILHCIAPFTHEAGAFELTVHRCRKAQAKTSGSATGLQDQDYGQDSRNDDNPGISIFG